jgi:uncharacterized protein (TIGR03435 family)
MKCSNRNARLTNLIVLAAVVAGIQFGPLLSGQSSSKSPIAFEVASIRPAIHGVGEEGSSRSEIESTADSLTMRNVDLREMVQWAYGLQNYQVLGTHMLEGLRYDIRARAGDRESVSTLRLMLQDLLATRFKVQLHREEKRTVVYELVVAKDGPRLPANKADTLPSSYLKESLPRVVDGSFVFTSVSITEFAQQLTQLRGIDLPVVDRTMIQGVYDITLKSAAKAILEPDGPSLLTLIQEQLGLKLVSAKDPIEVLTVDHAENPSAN